MSGDALVYDMAQSSRKDPSVFIKKDWLSILDEQNGNYSGNQCVINTSQIANSNRYMDMRQGYLTVPLLLTLTNNTPAVGNFAPATSATSADYALGLKNWIGTVVNSLTLNLNGTTIIQQSNMLPIWNNFKLLTTLSWNDTAMFPSMGFYPDSSLSFSFQTGASEQGIGSANNCNALAFPTVTGAFNSYLTGNEGMTRRQMYWNYDPQAPTGTATNTANFSTMLSSTYANQIYKSYIFTKQDSTATLHAVYQQAITGVIYLRHLSDFFDRMPLLKGIFMTMTLGISNVSVDFTVGAGNVISGASVTNSLGGVNPLLISSALAGNGANSLPADGYKASLSVGAKCLNTSQQSITGVVNSPLQQSVTLQVPSYVFTPQLEIAYLSQPVKRIYYEDIYQFVVQNVASGTSFNSLISNGISNMKKVLIAPFFTASANGGIHQLQSPFSTAGGGTTAELAMVGSANIVISGANLWLNTVKYSYEMWQNAVYGINSINHGLTDGVSSSLLSQQDWENSYCYMVGDVERMLDVEKDVPKSLSIVGQNLSGKEVDYQVFVSYGVEIVIDALTGARV